MPSYAGKYEQISTSGVSFLQCAAYNLCRDGIHGICEFVSSSELTVPTTNMDTSFCDNSPKVQPSKGSIQIFANFYPHGPYPSLNPNPNNKP